MSAARPTTYVIRVAGHLDDHWSSLLEGITVARDADGTTTLTGPVSDQAQLHGLLNGLRDIGADLLELRSATARTAGVGGSPSRRRPLPRVSAGQGPSPSVRPKGFEPPTF